MRPCARTTAESAGDSLYAATNPEEDIAESWTYFVLKAKPDGNTIAGEKVLFFYEWPELTKLRAQIIPRTYSRLRRE